MVGDVSKSLRPTTLAGFYNNKSILNSYRFSVWFNFDDYKGGPLIYLPRIEPYHILSVDIPFSTFNRESTAIGALQYSYPVLAKEQALDIKITMEEDDQGTIAGFIHEMQDSIVRNGYHVAPAKSRLGDMFINIHNQQNTSVSRYVARSVFFLGASSINMSYDTNDAVKYDLIFGTDYMEYSATNSRDITYPESTVSTDAPVFPPIY